MGFELGAIDFQLARRLDFLGLRGSADLGDDLDSKPIPRIDSADEDFPITLRVGHGLYRLRTEGNDPTLFHRLRVRRPLKNAVLKGSMAKHFGLKGCFIRLALPPCSKRGGDQG